MGFKTLAMWLICELMPCSFWSSVASRRRSAWHLVIVTEPRSHQVTMGMLSQCVWIVSPCKSSEMPRMLWWTMVPANLRSELVIGPQGFWKVARQFLTSCGKGACHKSGHSSRPKNQTPPIPTFTASTTPSWEGSPGTISLILVGWSVSLSRARKVSICVLTVLLMQTHPDC